jgi:thioredoxin 1
MPDVETLNSDYAGLIKGVKVDASKNRRLCLEPRVVGLPPFLFFKGGNEVKRARGEVDR